MLTIRLSRRGTKRKPVYRVIVVEKARDNYGTYIENLGTYNPATKEANIDAEKVQEWIAKGAQPSPTVHNLLITKEIIKGDKVRASKSKPGKKKQAEAAGKKEGEEKKEESKDTGGEEKTPAGDFKSQEVQGDKTEETKEEVKKEKKTEDAKPKEKEENHAEEEKKAE